MLIYPGVTPLDAIGPLQVFDLANIVGRQTLYEIITVAPDSAPVATSCGFAFLAARTLANLELPVDTLLVAGATGSQSMVRPDLVAWLRANRQQARRFGSICTGAFALGAAGLLDGKRATTHWKEGAELQRRHPAACVEIDAIFIRDGDLYTSAGISAGIDLALAMLEEDHGRDYALSIARVLVLFLKRSGGQAQFSHRLQAQFSTIPAIQQVQSWCAEHLDANLSVGALSRVAAMSERDFTRKFRQDTGRSPAEYVAAARLDAARQLLTETSLPLKAVALRCGFSSVASMRRAFVAQLGVVPSEYRERHHP